MIPDILIAILVTIINTFTALIGILNYFPPITSLFTSVSYVLSFTGYFYGVIDVTRFYTDLTIIISFEIFWFSFISIWWVIGFIRSIFSVGGTPGQ